MSKIIAVFLSLLVTVSLWAQSKQKDSKPKAKPVPVYLGQSDLYDGNVAKHTFDSLLRQGLISLDSAGRQYSINGFAFTYGERNLYEDSVGKLMWITDFLGEYCFGDTLSTYLINNITERSKPGDTVYFDNIIVKSPEGKSLLGRPMRLILTK